MNSRIIRHLAIGFEPYISVWRARFSLQWVNKTYWTHFNRFFNLTRQILNPSASTVKNIFHVARKPLIDKGLRAFLSPAISRP